MVTGWRTLGSSGGIGLVDDAGVVNGIEASKSDARCASWLQVVVVMRGNSVECSLVTRAMIIS